MLESSSMAKFIQENPDFPENSATPVPLTMKLFATAAKKAVSKQKLPDLLERIQNGENSILSNRIGDINNPITLDEIIASVNKEDLLCIEIVEEIGQKLGKQIAGLINLFNPELVIIGGTISLTGDYITQPIKTAVRKYSLNLVNKDSAIVTSKLKDRAGIVGACMLARSRMFEC